MQQFDNTLTYKIYLNVQNITLNIQSDTQEDKFLFRRF